MDANLESLSKELSGNIVALFNGIVEGGEDDLRKWGVDMANDMARAILTGSESLKQTIIDQGTVAIEINRLRLVNAGEAVVKQGLKGLMSGAEAALRAKLA